MTAPEFDVLMLMTGSTELKALRAEAARRAVPWQTGRGDGARYASLGIIAGDRVGASELKIRHAAGVAYECHRVLAETSATSVVLLGTAFGVNEERQRRADELVAALTDDDE